jgi:hypothetical protein
LRGSACCRRKCRFGEQASCADFLRIFRPARENLCVVSLVWIDPRFLIGPGPRQEGHASHELRSDQARDLVRDE